MANILLLAPLFSNGGITSWTKKFTKSFPDNEFSLDVISQTTKDKNPDDGIVKRILGGFLDLKSIRKNLRRINKQYDILHTTTSGSLGTVRDYLVAKWCAKNGIKAIMHCRYGCIPQTLSKKNTFSNFLKRTFSLYDQIWVLDQASYTTLSNIPELKGKIYLTPNSIEVKEISTIPAKSFKNYAFIANVIPTKGIFELIEGFKSVNSDDIKLHIIGPAQQEIIDEMKIKSGNLWENRITYYGRKKNTEVVEFMKSVDCLILPTYYQYEAFPISILEAMSAGKLVISTNRAAIPDMLTCQDGSKCGILVEEHSSKEIADAINWILTNKDKANEMCRKAYDKVKSSYSTEVVYEIYRNNYRKLIKNG